MNTLYVCMLCDKPTYMETKVTVSQTFSLSIELVSRFKMTLIVKTNCLNICDIF